MRHRHRPNDGEQVLVMEKDRAALFLALLRVGLGELCCERAELPEALREILRFVVPRFGHAAQCTTDSPADGRRGSHALFRRGALDRHGLGWKSSRERG